MREEEETSWFARWDEELPSPEELTPLSQTLITPDLALAFDIPTITPAAPNPSTPSPTPPLPEFDASGDLGGGADEPARTLKRPRLVWTPQLHKRFVDAVAHLGIKNAVPKTIMQLMSVDGLTRENVASHLQKYRLYLKRMQGLGSSGGGGAVSAADAADAQLFASAPIPRHFLARGPEPFVPFAALQHHQQQQQQYYLQRPMGHFGSSPTGIGFPHGFLSRAQPRVAAPQPAASYSEDLDSGAAGGGGRRVLTLFPTGED